MPSLPMQLSAEIARLRRENAALKEVIHEDHIDKWCFDTLLYVGRRMLAEYYRPSVIDGSSGDSGPQYVVALRNAIARIDEIRTPAP